MTTLPGFPLPKSVIVCDPEPVAVEGLRMLVGAAIELRFVGGGATLDEVESLLLRHPPGILVIDRSIGVKYTLEWIKRLPTRYRSISLLVWGAGMTDGEAHRTMQLGVDGAVSKSAKLVSLLTCLRTLAKGERWMDEPAPGLRRAVGAQLTERERQVAALVELGLRDKEIAEQLGIRPGTVKIHLKHIYEKTGIHGRYGLAITGLKEKGLILYPVI